MMMLARICVLVDNDCNDGGWKEWRFVSKSKIKTGCSQSLRTIKQLNTVITLC